MEDESAPLMVWRYDGEWTREPAPFEWPDQIDYETALKGGGFAAADTWGMPLTSQIEIAEHQEEDRWVIACSIDGNKVHNIHVIGLPNLLELLPKLSNIATASLLSRTAEKLDALVDAAGQAADRERARKRELRA